MKFFFGFGGKADNDVCAQSDIGHQYSAACALFPNIVRRYRCGASFFRMRLEPAWKGKWTNSHSVCQVANRFHQLVRDIDRVAGHEADAFDARNLIDVIEQIVEKAVPFRLVFAIAVDILSEQCDFFIALCQQDGGILRQCCLGCREDFRSAGIGDDAIGAVFIAAADDRDIGFDFVFAFGAKIIEFMSENGRRCGSSVCLWPALHPGHD